MDSLESAVDENVRTPPEISGAKREGSLRTGGWGGAPVVSATGDFFRFQLRQLKGGQCIYALIFSYSLLSGRRIIRLERSASV